MTTEDSCGITFTLTESQIVEGLVEEKSHKRIAMELGLALGTVNRRVKEISEKLPGNARPSVRIITWFWHTNGGSTGVLDGVVEDPPETP
ncbi:MAG TPA: LuxR C-terminal-related transcriptional regulator [Pseudodesulfovibrio sp.]|nr:LuxR C-terminal-related transcriptional regulator [Pseudodesulfovibrio sp.]